MQCIKYIIYEVSIHEFANNLMFDVAMFAIIGECLLFKGPQTTQDKARIEERREPLTHNGWNWKKTGRSRKRS